MYEKLAGMTGTAVTEAGEFAEIYDLEVVEIPTNEPIARDDQADLVYIDEDAKFDALVEDIVDRNEAGQPILVGTVSIEKSERLAEYLKRRGVRHEVLNAKHHEREGAIIAQAGRFGAVTVATNMAGRGVDIKLGGSPEELATADVRKRGIEPEAEEYEAAYRDALDRFTMETANEREKILELGGLYVLGTERHESRRIDNQLRGRSGRQGDPGESRFYLSLEDDLMRRFANDRVASIMARLRIPRDVPIEARMVSKAIERAQSQVEAQNFEIRKDVLKYDEVMNTQREIIYKWRNQILLGGETRELVDQWRSEVVEQQVLEMTRGVEADEWDWDELLARMIALDGSDLKRDSFEHPEDLEEFEVVEAYLEEAEALYAAREEEIGVDVMRRLERTVAMSIIDNKWREHLAEMDYLRSGIGLRAMGQKDPLVEYQREGYDLFADMVDAVKLDTVRYMYHVQVVKQEAPPTPKVVQTSGPTVPKRAVRNPDKVGRNDPCPCGSGRKYKHCHGRPGGPPVTA
jgi:preprotein translocase subunit SecA